MEELNETRNLNFLEEIIEKDLAEGGPDPEKEDRVFLLQNENSHPNESWLNHVVTSNAKRKIKEYMLIIPSILSFVKYWPYTIVTVLFT